MNSFRELHAMLILYRAATPEAQAEARRMLPDLGELIDLVDDMSESKDKSNFRTCITLSDALALEFESLGWKVGTCAMSNRVVIANPKHEIAYQEICDLVKRHSGDLSPLEILAIAANMIGKLVALQDQRKVTTSLAMQTIARNIENGNKQAVVELVQNKGSA
jgi:hypothetical protein